MKKLASLLIVAAMFAVVACGPSADEIKKQKEADSIKKADSIAKVEAEAKRKADSVAKAAEEQKKTDSIEAAKKKKK
jgi:hypothetical protein